MSRPDDVPLVSVVTATRNRPDVLRRALASIKTQSFEPFESIVIDDGSDEATVRAYEAIWADLDERFHLHKPPLPGLPGTGPSAARNRGIRLARGEFVAFLDDDDCWTRPDHLAVGIEALRRGEADYYFANMRMLRKDRVILDDWYPNSAQLTSGRRAGESPDVFEVALPALLWIFRHHYIHVNCSIVRRQLLDQLGGFWERVRYGEDYHLLLRVVAEARRTLYRPECVADYLVPEGTAASLIPQIEQNLQMISVSQHIRAHSENPAVRRVARAREGWNYREMSEALLKEGRARPALSLAWQALCVFPTPGACAHLAKIAARGLIRSLTTARPTPDTRPLQEVTATAP